MRNHWIPLVLIAVALSSPVWAAEAEGKPAAQSQPAAQTPAKEDAVEQKPALRGAYAIMVKELKLTDAQVAEMADRIKARDEAVAAWAGANKDKLAPAQKALKDAQDAKDANAQKKARAELNEITKGRVKVDQECTTAIMAVLTPEQHATWDCFQMYTGFMRQFSQKNIAVAEPQKAKCKEICLSLSKDMGVAKPDDLKGREALRTQAEKQIVDSVLTIQQRRMLRPPQTRPASAQTRPAAAQTQPALPAPRMDDNKKLDGAQEPKPG